MAGHRGESQVGAWAGLEVGVGLWLTDFKLLKQHTPFTIVAVCGWYFCKVPISCEIYTYIIPYHDSSCKHTTITHGVGSQDLCCKFAVLHDVSQYPSSS